MSAQRNPSTSLVSSIETVDRVCPRVPFQVFYNADHPEQRVFAGCKAYQCLVCGPRKARQVTAAMTWAACQVDRARFVTLTNAPEDWQTRRQRMRDLTRWARGNAWQWNVAWTTERGSQTGMVHIHALQWGSFVPQDALQDRWGAISDIRAVRGGGGAVSAYMAKESAAVGAYMSKEAATGYQDWLDLNGQRPLHWSRGFYHGLGIQDAVRAARVAQGRPAGTVWLQLTDPDELWQLYRSTRPTASPDTSALSTV